MQNAEQHERYRLGEIQGLDGGCQNGSRVAQVGVDVIAFALGYAREQGAGVREHDGVIVDIHDPGFRCYRLGHLVGIVGRWDAGADIQELPDTFFADQIADGAGEEQPVSTSLGDDGWEHLGDLITDMAVDRVVVFSADPVIPDTRGMRDIGLKDGPGRIRVLHLVDLLRACKAARLCRPAWPVPRRRCRTACVAARSAAAARTAGRSPRPTPATSAGSPAVARPARSPAQT